MILQRLQHTSVPRPPGEEAHRKALGFYGELLGLEHVPKPHTFTDIEVTWFKLGDDEIHVYAAGEDEPIPHSGAHFCLLVDDLDELRARLESAGYACREPASIPNRPRFATRDPFGNGIEFTSIQGDYLSPR